MKLTDQEWAMLFDALRIYNVTLQREIVQLEQQPSIMAEPLQQARDNQAHLPQLISKVNNLRLDQKAREYAASKKRKQ